jgi:hypothetical protein
MLPGNKENQTTGKHLPNIAWLMRISVWEKDWIWQ